MDDASFTWMDDIRTEFWLIRSAPRCRACSVSLLVLGDQPELTQHRHAVVEADLLSDHPVLDLQDRGAGKPHLPGSNRLVALERESAHGRMSAAAFGGMASHVRGVRSVCLVRRGADDYQRAGRMKQPFEKIVEEHGATGLR